MADVGAAEPRPHQDEVRVGVIVGVLALAGFMTVVTVIGTAGFFLGAIDFCGHRGDSRSCETWLNRTATCIYVIEATAFIGFAGYALTGRHTHEQRCNALAAGAVASIVLYLGVVVGFALRYDIPLI